MILKTVDIKNGIYSISPELIPEDMQRHTLVFYLSSCNAIVINEGTPVFDELTKLISAYLDLNEMERKRIMEYSKELDPEITNILKCIDEINAVRKK